MRERENRRQTSRDLNAGAPQTMKMGLSGDDARQGSGLRLGLGLEVEVSIFWSDHHSPLSGRATKHVNGITASLCRRLRIFWSDRHATPRDASSSHYEVGQAFQPREPVLAAGKPPEPADKNVCPTHWLP